MSLRYSLTMDDLVAFNVYHAEHSPQYQKSRAILRLLQLIFLGLFGFMIGAIVVFGIGPSKMTWGMWLGLVVGMVIAVVFSLRLQDPGLIRKRVRSQVRKMLAEGSTRTFLGEFTLTWSEEGLKETGELGESSYAWAAIDKIAVTDRHIFVYTSAVTAITIPLKDTPDNGAALLEALKQHRGMAPPSAVPSA